MVLVELKQGSVTSKIEILRLNLNFFFREGINMNCTIHKRDPKLVYFTSILLTKLQEQMIEVVYTVKIQNQLTNKRRSNTQCKRTKKRMDF